MINSSRRRRKNPHSHGRLVTDLFAVVVLLAGIDVCVLAQPQTRPAVPESQPTTDKASAERDAKEQARRQFQKQQLITAEPYQYIFNAGKPPRIIWRDVDEVRRLGGDADLRVRWFRPGLEEVDVPGEPGRWLVVVEGVAPNGTPVRRGLTCYCRPEGFLFYFLPDGESLAPKVPAPVSATVWQEHRAEVERIARDLQFHMLNNSEAGAILLAGLSEMEPLGRDPRCIESAGVRNDDFHLKLKLKLTGLADDVRPLDPPRERRHAAPVLCQGTPAEAGVHPDTKQKIDAVCREWAADTGEPFVTLVARHGVIITHEAFGKDKAGRPIDRDYRCEIFSLTKTITGMLFSLFIDQGLIGLDDSIATVFPDYPAGSPHVPTFRQCFTHTSGLRGHGEWDGVRNAYLDNIVLNGIDVNQPGVEYAYSGMGYELAAEAMELVAGKSALRLYHDHLFMPLGLGDIPMNQAASGARMTAKELATLAQWIANRGSYGRLEFISEGTFDKLLPVKLKQYYPAIDQEEGIGLHRKPERRPGAPRGSTQPADLSLGMRTFGHGSLSSCILRADLDTGVIVAQVRKTGGDRFGEWSARLFAAVADGLVDER